MSLKTEDWKKLLGSLAPALATALGGPLVGGATQVIARVLLGKDNATDEEIAAALSGASPEQMLALKQASIDYEKRLAELDIDIYKLSVDDRKDARKMFAVNMWPQITLSIVFIVGYFVALRYVLTGMEGVTPEILSMASVLLGLFTREIPTIMQFWFGSSHGSKRKTEIKDQG